MNELYDEATATPATTTFEHQPTVVIYENTGNQGKNLVLFFVVKCSSVSKRKILNCGSKNDSITPIEFAFVGTNIYGTFISKTNKCFL